MKKAVKLTALISLASVLIASGTLFATTPTPQTIASGWQTMSGGLAGHVVYFRPYKMFSSGVTLLGDSANIFCMDLTTGISTNIGKTYWTSNGWAQSVVCALSPDGTRFVFTDSGVTFQVMNIDGTNRRLVGTKGSVGAGLSWVSNSQLLLSTCTAVVRLNLNADNTQAGATIPVYSTRPTISGNCWERVDISGNYISLLDPGANEAGGGYNRPEVYNFATSTMRELVARNADGCQVCMRPDGHGTVMFLNATHSNAIARMYDISGASNRYIDSLRFVNMAGANSQGIHSISWSNDTNYLVHMGITSALTPVKLSEYPKYTWIRRMSDRGMDKASLFLGDSVICPDMWVGPVATRIIENRAGQSRVNSVVKPNSAIYTINGKKCVGNVRNQGIFIATDGIKTNKIFWKDGSR